MVNAPARHDLELRNASGCGTDNANTSESSRTAPRQRSFPFSGERMCSLGRQEAESVPGGCRLSTGPVEAVSAMMCLSSKRCNPC